MNIDEIQRQLKFYQIDGWLLYDFHGSNPLALSVMEVPEPVLMTRRCFYWVPQVGAPSKIVHQIESHNLDHLPGEKKVYFSWKEMHRTLAETVQGAKSVAMEYSPNQDIPTASVIDGGLIELIRGFGPQVVSSAPFLQTFTCLWSKKQYAQHKEAARVLEEAVEGAWRGIAAGKLTDEYQVQQFILGEFEKNGCVTEGEPICAVNANSADPHYVPTQDTCAPIQKGDFVLIDLWCKKKGGVFADITRVGVVGEPTALHEEIFAIVREAQKKGTDLIIERYREGKEVKGAEVDQVVREVIEKKGYGNYFTHRTGHNIHTTNHGPGANLDGIETLDDRPLIPRTCFSIEPGIYLPGEFGVRLEYDVYIHEEGTVEVTLPPQEKIDFASS
ncbi:M24 family metallopeptidase [Candidatus Neptunochlamydia vexilliferae]|nr:M24 family metallopeptidase [Candidatus Neptunochlamydia vexilliferae]